MAKEIEKEAIARHQADGTVPLGAHAVRCASPFDKPIKIDRSPSGLFHATGQHYAILIEAFKLFVSTYRDAAEKLKAGKLNVKFPPGAFPPPRPIVFTSALLAPD